MTLAALVRELRVRRWRRTDLLFAAALALAVPAFASAVAYTPAEAGPGTVETPANGTTVVGVQGFKYWGWDNPNKPPGVAGVDRRGEVEWRYGTRPDARWFYDVDPLDDGTVLVTAIHGRQTTVFRYDPATGERVWTEELDAYDTHDVDLIDDDELLVANMRNYNRTTGVNEERVFVYNRTTDAVTWEWYLREYYDPAAGGDYAGDWSHVNDVDRVREGEFLVSVRNMDQVLLVNRSTKTVEWALGADGNHSVLAAQHNPQYIETEDGRPTVLVADSENDRVVEYTRRDGTWNRTWTVGVGGNLTWPRDADRLPNGNTLVTDTLNHRVVEITPTGEVVWEAYTPWAPYDAERLALGDEPGGPTASDMGAGGRYAVTNASPKTPGAGRYPLVGEAFGSAFAGTPAASHARSVGTRWDHVAPWARPRWLGPWGFVSALLSAGLAGTALAVRSWPLLKRVAPLASPFE